MRARSRRVQPDEATSYWISFSDLATALLLAFVLILVAMLLRHQQQEKESKQRLEALVGVRQSLIARLKQEFKNKHQRVRVDEKTGALELPARVLFAYNDAQLTAQGRGYLDSFFTSYIRVLLSKEFRPHIAQIDIEGHADQSGSYISNMTLSQARAMAVCNYLFAVNHSRPNSRWGPFQRLVSVNGRSNVDPVYQDSAPGKSLKYDPDRSRRVTFKFRLKDDQLIQELDRLLGR